MILNAEMQRYDLNSYTAAFSFSAQPSRYFTFEEKSSWIYSTLNYTGSETGIHSFVHTLSLNLMPHKNWQLSWNNELYHTTDQSIDHSFFSDIMLSYRPGRWEFQLSLNNIFGNGSFERRTISSMQETYLQCRIRPREAMGKVCFSF